MLANATWPFPGKRHGDIPACAFQRRPLDKAGGPRPAHCLEGSPDTPGTMATLDQLLTSCTDGEAVRALDAAGHRSGMGQPFSASIVFHLRRAAKLPSYAECLCEDGSSRCPTSRNSWL